jgi:uncharacterized protein
MTSQEQATTEMGTASRMSRTSEARTREVLDRLLCQGVVGRDASAYLTDTYHPSVVIHEDPALPYGGTYEGLRGVAEHARAYLDTWDRHQRPEHRALGATVFYGTDGALVRWDLRVAHGETGTRSFPAVSHYRFADGLVAESRMFHFDTAALLAYLREHRP